MCYIYIPLKDSFRRRILRERTGVERVIANRIAIAIAPLRFYDDDGGKAGSYLIAFSPPPWFRGCWGKGAVPLPGLGRVLCRGLDSVLFLGY